MEAVIKFLQETGLFDEAQRKMLVNKDRISGTLQRAWTKYAMAQSNNSETQPSQTQRQKYQQLLTTGPSEMARQFMKDCEIPYRAKSQRGQYTVRSCSREAAKVLAGVIANPNYDIERLQKSIKNYYERGTFLKVFTNYMLEGVWEAEYEEYREGRSPQGTFNVYN